MSQQPFLQLYVGDYLADTLDLTTEEHGAYLLLLMTMWKHGAKLPNDHRKLARVARLSPAKFKRVWGEIGRFFYVDGDHVRNSRIDKEFQKATEKSQKRARAGSKGGKAKALKDKETGLAKATVLPWHLSEPDTVTNVTGDDVAEEDFAKQLFDRAVSYLGRHGVEEPKARQFVGQMRSKANDTEIFEAFSKASKAGAVDPMTYIRGILNPKPKPKKQWEMSPREITEERLV